MIYLDNAATTRQKPQPVIDAVVSAMTTCLDFYKLKETLAVGSITNMYAIAETLAAAGKVIKP